VWAWTQIRLNQVCLLTMSLPAAWPTISTANTPINHCQHTHTHTHTLTQRQTGRERKTESTADAAPISWISSTAFSAIKLQVIWLRANEMHTWNSVKVLAAELACFANSPDAQLYCDPNTNPQTNLNVASCPDHTDFIVMCKYQRCFVICSDGWYSPYLEWVPVLTSHESVQLRRFRFCKLQWGKK